MQTTEALVGGSGEQIPPEAETRLAFSRKFACFIIFGDAKNHSYLQSA